MQTAHLTRVLFQHAAARRRLGRATANTAMSNTFQHAAARRRLALLKSKPVKFLRFQHAAARRRLVRFGRPFLRLESFNTQPPEGGWYNRAGKNRTENVSTRSRPKAAGCAYFFHIPYGGFQHAAARRRLAAWCRRGHGQYGFNTQPPEGGWIRAAACLRRRCCFNTQPPEGGWNLQTLCKTCHAVSTRSRPKAAGSDRRRF